MKWRSGSGRMAEALAAYLDLALAYNVRSTVSPSHHHARATSS
jgi:hypothetical protein